MPPPLGAGSIMFSGCPSVRTKPEMPSFHQYMGPLVHPTNRDRFTTCPNGLQFCILMYLDHLQNWLVYGHGLLIFFNLGTIFTKWNGSNLGFPGISWRTHGGNGLKVCMLMYLDHLQKWLVYGHSKLIFLNLGFPGILAMLCEFSSLWWSLSENGQYLGFLCGSKWRRGVGETYFLTLCVEFCLVHYLIFRYSIKSS